MEENNEVIKNEEDSVNSEIYTHNSHPVQPVPLGLGQKVAVFFLVIFAVAAISMWAAQFKKSFTNPLLTNNENNNNLSSLNLLQEDSEESLKTKDTDNDGLTDWDELYIYNTSPYLEDSDSDGFTDKKEIESENDPNCPVGRDCSGFTINNNQNNNQIPIIENNQINIEEGNLENILSGQIEINELRSMLIQAGMEEEVLNQFSDEELIKYYQDLLNN